MDIDDVNFETLEITREGHVLEVVLDRPDSDVNAINGTVHRELALVFETLKNETQARAIILTGRGRAFSVGGDFKWFPELQDTSELYKKSANDCLQSWQHGKSLDHLRLVLKRAQAGCSVRRGSSG